MSHWLFEDGIGEQRALLIEGGQAVEARVALATGLHAGLIAPARLVRQIVAGKRGIVRFADGGEALLRPLPAGLCEGEQLIVEIVREAVHETGRYKLPLAKAVNSEPSPAPELLARISATDIPVQHVQPHQADLLVEHGWNEICEQALSGSVPFSGGSLHVALTPAMTLIDVDGELDPFPLALAGAEAVARSIRLFDLQGSIGIDFPSLGPKIERKAVDDALEAAIHGRFERTAMNGFGFVQIVTRSVRPSLPALLQWSRAATAARALMRQAERVREPGPLVLIANSAVQTATPNDLLAMLTQRTGRTVSWKIDDRISATGGYVQAVTL